MNKQLKAEEVKDGYIVVITTRYHVSMIQEVRAIIRYEGLIETVSNVEGVFFAD